MDKQHMNELILLSQEIYDQAAERMAHYVADKYGDVKEDTTSQQLEDYLFVSEEVSSYLLGNSMALLSAESQDTEIQTFEKNLRKVIAFAVKKVKDMPLPS